MKADQNNKRVLFLCTGNSCRSQMAEGWCRHLYSGRIEAYSAGLEAQGINPFAAKVMGEAGVDISQQHSTRIDHYAGQDFDLVVTVCDHAQQHCPVFHGGRVMHHSFEDPPKLAEQLADEDSKLDCYRTVRDEIHQWMLELENYVQPAVA